LLSCNDGSFAGTLTLDLNIGKFGKLDTLVFSKKVAFQRCIQAILNGVTFDVRSGTTFFLSFPIVFPKVATAATAKTPCDAKLLEEKGTEAFMKGNFVAALASYERSLACKWDQKVVPKAMLAACNAKNVAKAKFYLPKLSPGQQAAVVQRCLDNRIDPR
ncbi:MAG TPA: hypothetical protein VIU61_00465, partial [Kofleriaceae bacterium]